MKHFTYISSTAVNIKEESKMILFQYLEGTNEASTKLPSKPKAMSILLGLFSL